MYIVTYFKLSVFRLLWSSLRSFYIYIVYIALFYSYTVHPLTFAIRTAQVSTVLALLTNYILKVKASSSIPSANYFSCLLLPNINHNSTAYPLL